MPIACNQTRAFDGCVSVERINIPNIDQWWGCNWNGESNIIKSYKIDLYVDDEIITGVTSPAGTTTIRSYGFCSIKSIKEVTLTSDVTTIQNSAFIYFTGLEKITIPSSVTSYGTSIFREANALSSVTIYNDNVDLGPQNFVNVNNSKCGSGTGRLYMSGNYVFNTTYLWSIKFKQVEIGGNLSLPLTASTRDVFDKTTTEELRVGGNIDTQRILFNTGSALKFFECNGQILLSGASAGIISSTTNALIVHLGYNGICCPVEYLATSSVINSNIAKIYVGDGSSQASDQAVLDQYLADTDWANYSSKLDLWYNYNGEYKQ